MLIPEGRETKLSLGSTFLNTMQITHNVVYVLNLSFQQNRNYTFKQEFRMFR